MIPDPLESLFIAGGTAAPKSAGSVSQGPWGREFARALASLTAGRISAMRASGTHAPSAEAAALALAPESAGNAPAESAIARTSSLEGSPSVATSAHARAMAGASRGAMSPRSANSLRPLPEALAVQGEVASTPLDTPESSPSMHAFASPVEYGHDDSASDASGHAAARRTIAREEWARRMLHVQAADGEASVWIRDASIDPRVAQALLANLSAELRLSGTKLVSLTINGRAVTYACGSASTTTQAKEGG